MFPPALTVIAFILGYFTVYKIINFSNLQIDLAFWVGFMIGYWIYDLIHYSLHHIDTSKGKKGSYFHRLQQYHNQHHFGGEEKGFGVSSKFWDIVFRTEMSKKVVH